MANPFEVVTDNSGRINQFIPEGHPDVRISPENITESLNGGERVTLKDEEYDILPNGSLVHPDVEVISSVALGSGVRLDEGTTFHRFHSEIVGPRDKILVGDRARISGTDIQYGVEIGNYALILAKSIGGHTSVGQYVRIGLGTTIGHGVTINNTAKIDRDSQISEGVKIEKAARLGYGTMVGEGAQIGHHAKIGLFTGAGPRGVNQDGALIRPNEIVPPKTQVAA